MAAEASEGADELLLQLVLVEIPHEHEQTVVDPGESRGEILLRPFGEVLAEILDALAAGVEVAGAHYAVHQRIHILLRQSVHFDAQGFGAAVISELLHVGPALSGNGEKSLHQQRELRFRSLSRYPETGKTGLELHSDPFGFEHRQEVSSGDACDRTERKHVAHERSLAIAYAGHGSDAVTQHQRIAEFTAGVHLPEHRSDSVGEGPQPSARHRFCGF